MINRLKSVSRTLATFSRDVARTPRPRLFYAGGWLGHKNLGDEALFLACQALFSQYSFFHYRKESRALKMLHRVFRSATAAVLAGGTLINRGGRNLTLLRDCLDICGSGVVFGSGVADPAFWTGRAGWQNTLKDWKPVLERCQYVGVRGPRSQEILADIGIQAEIIGDPVIVLADEALTSEENQGEPSVGFNVGHSLGNLWGQEEIIAREFSRLAQLARKAGWKVRWYVVWPDDREITLQAARDSHTEAEVHEVYEDPNVFMDLVRSSTAFVGMKLHAVVLATCAYVPSVMVEYRPKCRDYMRSIEQEAYTVRTDDFTGEVAWSFVTELQARRRERSRSLFDKLGRLKEKQLAKVGELTRRFRGI
jgi:hypothetical protein